MCPQPHAAEAPGCTQRLAEYYRRHAKPHEQMGEVCGEGGEGEDPRGCGGEDAVCGGWVIREKSPDSRLGQQSENWINQR